MVLLGTLGEESQSASAKSVDHLPTLKYLCLEDYSDNLASGKLRAGAVFAHTHRPIFLPDILSPLTSRSLSHLVRAILNHSSHNMRCHHIDCQ